MKKGYELIFLGAGVGGLIGLFTGIAERATHGVRTPHPALFTAGAALAGAGIGTLGFGAKQKMVGVAVGGGAVAVVGGLIMRHYYMEYARLLSPVVITEDGSLLDTETGAAVPLDTIPAGGGTAGVQLVAR